MTVLNLTSQTDAEGGLHLDTGVPNSKVHVIVEIDEGQPELSEERRKEWEEFVRRTAGSITDPTFRRHPQGEFPKREELT